MSVSITIQKPMSASDLYALSQGRENRGTLECHWCISACGRDYLHDEPPPIPFVKMKSLAKRAGNPHICHGCYLWRRKSITTYFLNGTFKDRQTASQHSWWITRSESKAIKDLDYQSLYKLLLKPPHQFVLSLVEQNTTNHLHLAVANDLVEIKVGTPLAFTINNIPMTYTIYELNEAIKNNTKGKEPGVHALIRFLGEYKKEESKPEETRRVGRPDGQFPDAKVVMEKVIAKSGIEVT